MMKVLVNQVSGLMLSLICIILLSSCEKELDSDTFFNFPISEIKDCKTETALEIPYIGNPGGNMVDCIIKDSLLFSFSFDNEYVYSVSSINSGELICQLFQRGRAGNEPLQVLPIWDLYEDNGKVKGLIFSFLDSRLFVCDISSSLSSGQDVYDRVVKLEWEGDGFLSLLRYYQLNDSTIIGYNTMDGEGKEFMVRPPVFEIYDSYTGKLGKRYDLFNMIEYKSDNKEYTSVNYLYNYSDIKPDRSKLAFAMANMPQINIMEVATGKARGYKIKGHKGFTAKKPCKHFSAAQCDDEYIYALYSDKELETKDSDILYVFDWDGNVKRKYRLDNSFTQLHIDGDMLYFSHGGEDKLYGLPTASII